MTWQQFFTELWHAKLLSWNTGYFILFALSLRLILKAVE